MRCIFSAWFLFFVLSCSAQQNVSNLLKNKIYNKTIGKENFDVLIKGDSDKLTLLERNLGFKIKYHEGDISCVSLNAFCLDKLAAESFIEFIEYTEPHKASIVVLADSMLKVNRIYGVKKGYPPLKKAYDGTGVIIGIIDTGIDITHPDFKDASGQTRIKYIWDQKAKAVISPDQFGYGLEWTAEQINRGECDHLDTLQNGHGTLVSGIAAGNGNANREYEGCAPNAELIVVALDFNRYGSTFADAVKYISDKAAEEGKPFVINISAGNYYGSHDAKDLQSQLIERIIANKPGRALVAAAGNAGNQKIHTKYIGNGTDTLISFLRCSKKDPEYFLYADTSEMKEIRFSVGANRNNLFDLGRIKFANYRDLLGSVKSDTLRYKKNRIGIIQTSASTNDKGICEVYIKIITDSLAYTWRVESFGKGSFDSWNYDFLTDKSKDIKLSSVKKWIVPDNNHTIVSGFQCSDEVITVSNYSLRTGSISISSSIGPTRDKRMKPDIAATGDGVVSCVSKTFKERGNRMQNEIVDNNYTFIGGTSAASAVVTGMIALYFQANPNTTNRNIKNQLKKTAVASFPDLTLGFGKLDGFNSMVSPK